MSKSSEESVMPADDAVEALLEKAVPRPSPPDGDERIVRDAVFAEWQAVTGKVRIRRRMAHLAIAATVLLGIAVSFNALQLTDVQAVQVATIHKSHGSIYLLGEQFELQEMTDLASIYAGQIIETGVDAGIGLEWGDGGSLRVDEKTRIDFTSADAVYLHWGRIYIDSQAATLVAGISGRSSKIMAGITNGGFEIETVHGSVSHLGTQYMTFVDSSDLTVSVREGEVAVDGRYVGQSVAVAGQQMTLSGGAQPSVLDFDGHGEAWDWIEATAPSVNMDGRSTFEFLQRIGRETGLTVEFDSAGAETLAREGILNGTIEMEPRDELAFRMSGEDLSYCIDRGTIKVSAIDSGSCP
jgi:hypothetical protein